MKMNFASIISARTLPSPRPARRTAARANSGFSLLEMVIVIALVLIAGTIALLLAQQVTRSVHLQEAATNYSNFLQQARIRSVQDDNYYSVKIVAASSGNPAMAYIDVLQSGTFNAAKDPVIYFTSDVKQQSRTAAPNVSNLESQFLPAGGAGTVDTTHSPTFSARGLPCSPSSTSGGTCYSATPTSYEIFFKNTSSLNWEAVTITPAGRIHQWSHSATSGTWSPMN